MIIAEVAGTLVAETRADRLDAPVYLLVTPAMPDGRNIGSAMIALDTAGAGIGELVLVSQGSSARQTQFTIDKPVDALIVGIIDSVVENGLEVYQK